MISGQRVALALGAALACVSPTLADAADLHVDVPRGDYTEPAPGSMVKWYVRLDGGYGVIGSPDLTEAGVRLTGSRFDDTWMIGGGLGRYFTPTLRGDVTVDHRFGADVTGDLFDPAAPVTGRRRFGLASTVVLANLYYDFDFGSRFVPYVGGGLGVAFNHTSGGTIEACGCTGPSIAGDESTDFAAAVMAGATIQLTKIVEPAASTKDDLSEGAPSRGLYLDLGYRFLYLGEFETGPVTATTSTPTVSAGLAADSLTAHEFRVGLRYDIR